MNSSKAHPAVRDDDRRRGNGAKGKQGQGRRDGWRITGHLWGYDIIHDVRRRTDADAVIEFIMQMGGKAEAKKVTMNAIIL